MNWKFAKLFLLGEQNRIVLYQKELTVCQCVYKWILISIRICRSSIRKSDVFATHVCELMELFSFSCMTVLVWPPGVRQHNFKHVSVLPFSGVSDHKFQGLWFQSALHQQLTYIQSHKTVSQLLEYFRS